MSQVEKSVESPTKFPTLEKMDSSIEGYLPTSCRDVKIFPPEVVKLIRFTSGGIQRFQSIVAMFAFEFNRLKDLRDSMPQSFEEELGALENKAAEFIRQMVYAVRQRPVEMEIRCEIKEIPYLTIFSDDGGANSFGFAICRPVNPEDFNKKVHDLLKEFSDNWKFATEAAEKDLGIFEEKWGGLDDMVAYIGFEKIRYSYRNAYNGGVIFHAGKKNNLLDGSWSVHT